MSWAVACEAVSCVALLRRDAWTVEESVHPRQDHNRRPKREPFSAPPAHSPVKSPVWTVCREGITAMTWSTTVGMAVG